jgi:hypothetical protein
MLMAVSRQNESRNNSPRPGAAISSAKTGPAMIRAPRPSASSSAACAIELSVGSRSQRATTTFVSIAVVMPAYFSNPRGDSLPSGANSRVPDTSIFGERALGPCRPYPYPLFIPFKQQPVSGPHAQRPADLAGYGYLTLASDFCLLPQWIPPIFPYFTTELLTSNEKVEFSAQNFVSRTKPVPSRMARSCHAH